MLKLLGDLDVWGLNAVQQQIESALSVPSDGVFTIDLCDVSFMDSAAIGLLIHTHKRLDGDGSHLRLIVRPGTGPDRVLQITGLDRIFDLEREDLKATT